MTIINNPNLKYQELFSELYILCKEQNWGDPFSYARSREIHLACILGHKISNTFYGADAFDDDGECEYKTTTNKNIIATYNGISFFFEWDQQEKYLVEDKLGKYKNHYYARYDGPKIVEIYKLDCNQVLSILLPKIKKDWDKKSKKSYKDPRLSSVIHKSDIYKYGKKLR